jgi:hypothetical protein
MKFGVPGAICTDNGPPFSILALGGVSRLSPQCASTAQRAPTRPQHFLSRYALPLPLPQALAKPRQSQLAANAGLLTGVG